jgi:hypothetical protein
MEGKMTGKRQIETTTDLENIVDQQDRAVLGLGDLVRAMDGRIKEQDQKIKLLTALVDSHQAAIQKLTGISPRPGGEPIVH